MWGREMGIENNQRFRGVKNEQMENEESRARLSLVYCIGMPIVFLSTVIWVCYSYLQQSRAGIAIGIFIFAVQFILAIIAKRLKIDQIEPRNKND